MGLLSRDYLPGRSRSVFTTTCDRSFLRLLAFSKLFCLYISEVSLVFLVHLINRNNQHRVVNIQTIEFRAEGQ